jgi:SAM-dependent methyltransferase
MTSYYDGPDIEELVLGALRASGRSLDPLDPDDLAGLDEFHALGRAGTLALANLAEVRRRELGLDVGAGIGGPSRVLARHYGAIVTALEPTRRFASLAGTLTDRAGLADQVTIVKGDGRTLPFADAGFDLVWTQAVWQSVEDKTALSAEIHRVLRPRGRLALLEVIGDGRELHSPVPWADGPAESFVVTGDAMAGIWTRSSSYVPTTSTGRPIRRWRSRRGTASNTARQRSRASSRASHRRGRSPNSRHRRPTPPRETTRLRAECLGCERPCTRPAPDAAGSRRASVNEDRRPQTIAFCVEPEPRLHLLYIGEERACRRTPDRCC